MTKAANITFKKLLKKVLRFLLGSGLFLCSLFAVLVITLQIPKVQTFAIQKATGYLSKKLNYPIGIQSVDISWFDVINLEKLTVYDKHKNQMIYLGQVSVDFTLNSLLHPELSIDEIILRNGKVKVYRFSSDSSINISDFVAAIQDMAGPGGKSNNPPSAFIIKKVKLENMFFSYYDQRRDLIREGFDYNHFSFSEIYSDVENLTIIADTFRIHVNDLTALERQTGLKIKNLSVDFGINRHAMTFDHISTDIGNSHISDYLAFEFDNINDLSDFNEKIEVKGTLKETKIYTRDLANFASALSSYDDYAFVSGVFSGKVTNFDVKDLIFKIGKNTKIRGRASLKGLPDLEETYIDFKFHNSKVTLKDLRQYFPRQVYSVLKKFGSVSGTGEFVGFPYDFVTKGTFKTNLGYLESDLNLKLHDDIKPASQYSGHLITDNFNLGKLLDLPDKIQTISMDGNVKGKGLTLSEAELKMDARISKLGVNHYNYQGIEVNADFSDQFFNGFLGINDPNLKLTVNGEVNLKENVNKFNIKTNIEKGNLKPLHLSNRETFIISTCNLNFTGLKPDDIEGNIKLTNTYLLYEDNKEVFIDTLFAFSNKNGNLRRFNINSDLLTLRSSGNFEFSNLLKDLPELYREYLLNMENDQLAIEKYYNQKRHRKLTKPGYQVDFSINVKNLNGIFAIYTPGLYLSGNTVINGSFAKSQTSILNLNTHFDTLFYQENELYQADIELATSKLVDSSKALAMFYLNSKGQSFKDVPTTENLFIEGVWHENMIDFTGKIKEKTSTNRINLKGYLSLENHQEKILHLANSSFTLLDKTWKVNNKNTIRFAANDMVFENLSITQDSTKLSLSGEISPNPGKIARLKVSNFNLATLNPIIETNQLDGMLNGNLELKDILNNNVNLGGEVDIDTLKVDGFLIGNVTGKSNWNNRLKQLEVDVEVTREDSRIMAISGSIKQDKSTKNQNLNLTATLNDANLDILNPILKGVFSDVGGTASGTFKILGTPNDLVLKGKADVKKGRFKADYLNTTYFFDDYIYLDHNLIGFKKLKLKDQYGDIAVINGGIYHDSFRDFVLDIKAWLNTFQVLNTTEKDNELFYGTAFVSGNIELLGDFNDVEINANATSKKGTKVFIPITSGANVEQQSYIRFIPPPSTSETTMAIKDTSHAVELSGLKMNLNLEITPDAYVEIIFDKRAGDIIRGKGSGNLKMEIDTRGDFFLYGTYNIDKGSYNFTLANLINKEFSISPNSSISWFGDPYQGTLDIQAVYHQSASLKPLIIDADSTLAAQEGLKRYPVDVVLNLTGNLMSPDIKLGISIKNYSGQAANYVTNFETMLQNNEQELNRQVFSLLVLGGFSSPSSFTGLAADPTSNLSELLTNQLGNWLSQVDNNLQIDMDLRGLDRQALNTFNLRLSYTLLDGRLRISRNGRFTNNAAQNNSQNNISNIAGEWTIEYLLAPDGKLRVKLYNKNNQNMLMSGVTSATNTSAGFSLLHTQSFNNLEDLLWKKKPKVITLTESMPQDSSSSDSTQFPSPSMRQDSIPFRKDSLLSD